MWCTTCHKNHTQCEPKTDEVTKVTSSSAETVSAAKSNDSPVFRVGQIWNIQKGGLREIIEINLSRIGLEITTKEPTRTWNTHRRCLGMKHQYDSTLDFISLVQEAPEVISVTPDVAKATPEVASMTSEKFKVGQVWETQAGWFMKITEVTSLHVQARYWKYDANGPVQKDVRNFYYDHTGHKKQPYLDAVNGTSDLSKLVHETVPTEPRTFEVTVYIKMFNGVPTAFARTKQEDDALTTTSYLSSFFSDALAVRKITITEGEK